MLPQAWANRPAWTILDTDFGDGGRFLAITQAWRADPDRSQMLHYVGIAKAAPQSLGAPIAVLGPGFHRLLLDDARVSLTLCLGDVSAMLREQLFHADMLIARPPVDKWEVQALARRCKRGTRFWMPGASGDQEQDGKHSTRSALLQAAGFRLDAYAADATAVTGCFDPQWTIATGRTRADPVQTVVARCAVVGAGIAGASVAHALAVRGWQVTVFDSHAQSAGGASGLPVGLAVPHLSADDNPRSRLSRHGANLLQQHARRLLRQGQDWDPTGVLERLPTGGAHWHAQACWIKPAQLVRAWLAQTGIRFLGGRTIAKLHLADGLWQVSDPQGVSLGCFEVVVVANAMGCVELLSDLLADGTQGLALQAKLAALQPVHGTLSQGSYAQPVEGLPSQPVNGDGSFIPRLGAADTEQWFAGSTFETDPDRVSNGLQQHAVNMERLQRLLSASGNGVIADLNRAPVSLWSSTRCVTHDRYPLVGPVDAGTGPGVWLCAGMGSRGLSFSALCAELLVARLGAEPLPLEASLSRSLDVHRLRRGKAVSGSR